jgi:Domain of unknown function (DUF4157)
MVHSRIRRFSAENPSIHAKSSQFASRPAIQPQPDSPTFPLGSEIETETSDRDVEAFGLHFAPIPVHAPNRPVSALGQPPLAIPQSYPIAPIQAKLMIGQPNDKYEQQADRIAAQVVNQINTPQPVNQTNDKEDAKPQMKPSLQPQSNPQLNGDSIPATPELEAKIGRSRSDGHPLAESIRRPLERSFGTDFSQVKVHTDAQADQLNRSIQARAFTTGQAMFFRQGAYQPGSRVGQELIAHELTHVVQQNGGAMQRSAQKENAVDVAQQTTSTIQRATRDAQGNKVRHKALSFQERDTLTRIQRVIQGTPYETVLNFLHAEVLSRCGKPAVSEFYKGAHIIFNDAGAVYNQLFQLAQPIATYRAQTWGEWLTGTAVPQTPDNLKPSTGGGGGLGRRTAGTTETSHYGDAQPGTPEKIQLGIDLPSPCQGHILVGIVPNLPHYGRQAGCTFVQTEMYGFLTYYDKYIGHLGGAIKNKFWALQSGLVGTSTHSEKTTGGSTAIVEQ